MITSQMKEFRGRTSDKVLGERMPKAVIKDALFCHVSDVMFNK